MEQHPKPGAIKQREVSLSVGSADLSAEDLHALTANLSRTLIRETDVRATWPEQEGVPGNKGVPIEIGTLLLTFITSGAAVAMFQVLKSYFERSSSLEMEFQREDGKKLLIRAENVQPERIDQTMNLAREFFGEGQHG